MPERFLLKACAGAVLAGTVLVAGAAFAQAPQQGQPGGSPQTLPG